MLFKHGKEIIASKIEWNGDKDLQVGIITNQSQMNICKHHFEKFIICWEEVTGRDKIRGLNNRKTYEKRK